MEYRNWRDLAACKGTSGELFIFNESQSNRYENTENFKKAETICQTCPVALTCWRKASEEDRKYTVRGGEWPSQYFVKKRPGAVKEFCHRGHDTRNIEARDAHGECRECRKINARESKRRARARAKAVV